MPLGMEIKMWDFLFCQILTLLPPGHPCFKNTCLVYLNFIKKTSVVQSTVKSVRCCYIRDVVPCPVKQKTTSVTCVGSGEKLRLWIYVPLYELMKYCRL